MDANNKRIELLKPHTDNGRDYPAGAKLTLDKGAAEWLIALGVAQELPADDAAAKSGKK